MTGFGGYLVCIIAAAMICSISAKLIHKGVIGSVIRLLGGVFMALAMLSPIVRIRLSDFEDLTQNIRQEADAAVSVGQESFHESISAIISDRITAYILDKANSLELAISVTVSLSNDTVPIPKGVTLQGRASPYAKNVLTKYITQELGIDSEEIKWTP